MARQLKDWKSGEVFLTKPREGGLGGLYVCVSVLPSRNAAELTGGITLMGGNGFPTTDLLPKPGHLHNAWRQLVQPETGRRGLLEANVFPLKAALGVFQQQKGWINLTFPNRPRSPQWDDCNLAHFHTGILNRGGDNPETHLWLYLRSLMIALGRWDFVIAEEVEEPTLTPGELGELAVAAEREEPALMGATPPHGPFVEPLTLTDAQADAAELPSLEAAVAQAKHMLKEEQKRHASVTGAALDELELRVLATVARALRVAAQHIEDEIS